MQEERATRQESDETSADPLDILRDSLNEVRQAVSETIAIEIEYARFRLSRLVFAGIRGAILGVFALGCLLGSVFAILGALVAVLHTELGLKIWLALGITGVTTFVLAGVLCVGLQITIKRRAAIRMRQRLSRAASHQPHSKTKFNSAPH